MKTSITDDNHEQRYTVHYRINYSINSLFRHGRLTR